MAKTRRQKRKMKAARKAGVAGLYRRFERDRQEAHSSPDISLHRAPWDHGATGSANRVGLVVEERGEIDPKSGKVRNPNGVTGVRRMDMLEIYYRRDVISLRGYIAGLALREAWLRTGVGTCAPWLRERVDSSPKPDAAIEVQIDRLSALLRISRLVSHDDDAILDAVVARGVGLADCRQYRGRNHDAGKKHLHDALERLADKIERRG